MSTRLSIMQCRCQFYGQILHSGSKSELRNLRLASLLQCPIFSFRWFWSRQNRRIEYSRLGAGYFSHTFRSNTSDFALFCRKLRIWFISFGITFRFQFQFTLFRVSFFQLLCGKQSESLTLAFPFLSFFALTLYLPMFSSQKRFSSYFTAKTDQLAYTLLSLSADML